MKGHLLDLLAISGGAAVLTGLAHVYYPLAWIAGGITAIAVAVLIERRHPPRR